ncbi:SDR family oxidoreductase [Phycicoccus sp. CSK15P-2]|uniref:SDR family NAD(P)-dependent oxidoreductase n=1 Tax=Phycicoccus sp. CSK15P-2 TaxID=2807627 RepID=UPI00194F35B1|nr:SDR family oxidoreductase [Phycicoccus sp. CSK15P-2]MBM6404439.1 SDR family oxidoreductase [Phycicoccus sp. CSK15P-2]
MSTALVTGASAGIGRALATRLAHDGRDLVLVARDRARLERLADGLRRERGVEVEVLVADLADRAQTEEVCRRLADPDRPVDLLVNNAGFGLRRPFLENDVREEEAALDVMVRAVLLTSHAAGRAMRARGRGAILNVSSVAGFMASGTYSAEKSFVTVFSESLAGQLRGTGVTVTAVCPGFTRTEFHERARMRRPGVPDWVWSDADELARQALADVAAGKVVSVPGPHWKAAAFGLRALPRPLVRGQVAQAARWFRRRG